MMICDFFVPRQFRQNIGGGLEFQRHRALALDLLLGGVFRAIVGDGGGLDHDAGCGQKLQNGIAHFFGGFDPRDFRCARRRQSPSGR